MNDRPDLAATERALTEMLRDDDAALPATPSAERIVRLRRVVDAQREARSDPTRSTPESEPVDLPIGIRATDADRGGAQPTTTRREPVAAVAPLRTRRWTRMLAVAAALVVVFTVGVAVGGSPPSSIRDAGSAVGLPMESSREFAVHDAVDELGDALDVATDGSGEAPGREQLDRVASADAAMLEAVGELSPEEVTELRPVAHQVHLRAVELFASAGSRLPTAKDTDLVELDR